MPITFNQTILVVSCAGLIQWILSEWMKARFQSSIKHEYDEKLERLKAVIGMQLEDYRAEIRRRELCTKVAELLAAELSLEVENRDFNKLAWEAALILPSDVLRKLTSCLTTAGTACSPKEIITELRQVIQGRDDGVRSADILHKGQLGFRR